MVFPHFVFYPKKIEDGKMSLAFVLNAGLGYKTPREKGNYKLLASKKFYAIVKSLLAPEWWRVKWMATMALKAKTLKFQ